MIDRAERLNSLVGLVYDAALEPSLWPSILDGLADVTNGSHAVLLTGNIVTGSGEAEISSGLGQADMVRFHDYYSAINPLLIVPDASSYSSTWSPLMLRDEDWLPRKSLENSEYFADFLRPLDASRAVHFRLGLEGEQLKTINVSRGRHQEHFSDEEMGELAPLHIHCVRAAQIGQHFMQIRNFSRGALAALDAATDAVVMLDAQGRVVHANSAADRLLSEGAVVSASGRRLSVQPGPASDGLARAINEAGSGHARAAATVPMIARDGSAAGTAHVFPIGIDAGVEAACGPAILVRFGGATPEDRLEARMNRFALTGAERNLVRALIAGATLSDAARERGTRLNTARRQIASVFDKTGTHRQAELMLLLTRDA